MRKTEGWLVLLSHAERMLRCTRGELKREVTVSSAPLGQCFVHPIEIYHSLYFQALVRLGYKFLFRTRVAVSLLIITEVKRKWNQQMYRAFIHTEYTHYSFKQKDHFSIQTGIF